MKKIFFVAVLLMANSAFAEFGGKIQLSEIRNLARSFKGQFINISEMNKYRVTSVRLPNNIYYGIVLDGESTSPNQMSANANAISVINLICRLESVSVVPSSDNRAGGSMDYHCIVR
jgi:hypothetical protein